MDVLVLHDFVTVTQCHWGRGTLGNPLWSSCDLKAWKEEKAGQCKDSDTTNQKVQAQPTRMLLSTHLISIEIEQHWRKWIKISDHISSDSTFCYHSISPHRKPFTFCDVATTSHISSSKQKLEGVWKYSGARTRLLHARSPPVFTSGP
jgi:hypothetical protein